MTLSNFLINTPLHLNGIPILCPFPEGYNNTEPYNITSSDSSIILISGNILVPKNAGTSTITFTQNNISISTIVTVQKLLVDIIPDNVTINYSENIPSSFDYEIKPYLTTSCDILNANITIPAQKIGYGINLPTSTKVSDLTNITINRADNGLATNPYISLWIRDPNATLPYNINNYAVISISPNWNGSFKASYSDMQNESIGIYDSQGNTLLLSNLADAIVESPSTSLLSTLDLTTNGFDTGIPRYGFNWIFGFINHNGDGIIKDYILSNVSVNNKVEFNSYIIRNGNDANSTPPTIIQTSSYISSDITIGTISTNANNNLDVGTYNITPINFSTTNTNYNISENIGTLTITPIQPVLSWSSLSPIQYGTVLSTTQLSAISTNTIDQITYDYSIGTKLDSGDTVITATQVVTGGNYIPGIYTLQNTITVNKTNITIKANAKIMTYGTTVSNLQYTVDTGHDLDVTVGQNPVQIFIGTPKILLTDTEIPNVGTYDITLNKSAFTTSNNYTLTFENSTLTVNKHPIEITAQSQNIKYGEYPDTSKYTVQSGYSAYVTRGRLYIDPLYMSNIGTYNITFIESEFITNSNYTIIFKPSTLIITPYQITISADSHIITYGSNIPILTYDINQEYSSHIIIDDSVDKINTTATNNSPVGTYSITLNRSAFRTDSDNYSILFNDSTLSINQKTISVTASSNEMTYGSIVPSLIYTVESGFENHVLAKSDPMFTLAGSSSPIGTYLISFNINNFTTSENYTLLFIDSIMTIIPYPIRIQANPVNTPYGSPIEFSHTIEPGYSSFVSVDDNYISSNGYNGSNVGNYDITLNPTKIRSNSPNYTLSLFNSILTITQATSKFTWNPLAPIIYGTSLSSIQLSTTSTNNFDPITYNYSIGTILDAGNNIKLIATQVVTGGNYTPGTYTIENTINVNTYNITVTATQQSMLYGSNVPTLTRTITPPDYFSYLVIDSNPLSTTGSSISDIGNYDITLDQTKIRPINANYSITYINSILTINPIQPVLSWQSLEPIIYETLLSPTQLCAISTNTSDPITYNYPNGTKLDAGVTVITATQVVTGGNYIPGTYTIENTINVNTYNITVTADPQSMSYGSNVPTLTLTVTPSDYFSYLIIGSNPISTTGSSISNIGNYEITLDQTKITPINTNYSITYVNSILTITKATSSFTWTPISTSFVYGESLSGFLNAVPLNDPGNSSIPIGTMSYSTTGYNPLTTILPYSSTPYVVTATLTVTNNNYNSSSTPQTKNLIINKQIPIISWTPNLTAITYGTSLSTSQLNAILPNDIVSGNPLGTYTYSITSIGNVSIGTILPASSPGYYITATLNLHSQYTNNYVNNQAFTTSTALVVNKKTAIFLWTSPISSVIFEDQLTSSVLNATAIDSIDNVSPLGIITYTATPTGGGTAVSISNTTSNLSVGTYTLRASLNVTNVNHAPEILHSTNSNILNITRDTPNFTWNGSLANINYGTPLSSTQLNATSPIDKITGNSIGTISYNYSMGQILNAGTYTITAYLTITSSTSSNYLIGTYSATNTLIVNKINAPIFTWNKYLPPIAFNCPLSNDQLNAVSLDSIDGITSLGNITYKKSNNSALNNGSILNAGTHIITATLVVTNPNYNSITQTVTNTLVVVPIIPTITYYTPREVVPGTIIRANDLDAITDLPNGNITYNIQVGSVISTKTKIVASLTPPYHNNNFIDEPVSTYVILNTI